MSAVFDVDNGVIEPPMLLPVQADDPFSRLFFDRTTSNGTRLLAVAEPVDRKPEAYLAAHAAIVAFEEALIVASAYGAEAGLYRAFNAANDAVRGANRGQVASRRSFAGITAFVIEGSRATIGYVPPGQALLIQDGRLYGVPELASWMPGYLPGSDQELSDPLGFTTVVRPLIRKTEIGVNDQFVLGASAVGRVLATRDLKEFPATSQDAVIDRLEAALADSNVDDAYAAWIRCDPAPSTPANSERMAEIERSWRGESTGISYLPMREAPQPPRERVSRLEGIQGRMIETSERIFARKEAEALPMESRRRQATPLGAGSLQRYVAPSALHVGSGLRQWMPRGLRFSKRGIFFLLMVGVLMTALIVKRDVALGRDSKHDGLLTLAKTELQLARGAESIEEANTHLALAERSLDRAASNGADEGVIAGWRNEVANASDDINGQSRFRSITRLGSFPASVGASSHLLMANGRLYLISTGVFEIAPEGRELIEVLAPGDQIDSVTVEPILASSVDRGSLVVSDGATLFRLEDSMWTASRIRSGTTGQDGGEIAGAYKGSYYLLDSKNAQIKKYGVDDLAAAPVNWLTAGASAKVGEPIDLAVDGNIYLLCADGTIQVFYKGELKTTYDVVTVGDGVEVIGMYRGASGNDLYVVAIDNGAAKLIRFDRKERTSVVTLPPSEMHLAFTEESAEAFAEATDFVVDDANGRFYFLTATGIWQAEFDI